MAILTDTADPLVKCLGCGRTFWGTDAYRRHYADVEHPDVGEVYRAQPTGAER